MSDFPYDINDVHPAQIELQMAIDALRAGREHIHALHDIVKTNEHLMTAIWLFYFRSDILLDDFADAFFARLPLKR